jgi:hypothetical protein
VSPSSTEKSPKKSGFKRSGFSPFWGFGIFTFGKSS